MLKARIPRARYQVLCIGAILLASGGPIGGQGIAAQPDNSRSRAIATSCLTNIRQVSLGCLMFLQDHDERFALKPDSYKTSLMPYLKSDRVFHCPGDSSGGVSYSFNRNLAGVSLSHISAPAQTVMIYEGKAGKLNYRHNGTALVGFADGHAKMIRPATANALRWKP